MTTTQQAREEFEQASAELTDLLDRAAALCEKATQQVEYARDLIDPRVRDELEKPQ